MRTLLATVLAAAAIIVSGVSSPAFPSQKSVRIKPSDRIVTEKRSSAMNFTKVRVSRMISLVVEERTDNVIVIRTADNVMPYVRLSVSKGCLTATIDESADLRGGNTASLVEIAIPDNGKIGSVEISSVSSVTIVPKVEVPSFRAELSGVSTLAASVSAQECSIEASGVSCANINFDGGSFNLDLSGVSVFNGKVKAVKSIFDISGASTVNIAGSSSSQSLDISGASHFLGSELVSGSCNADLSGASDAVIYCTNYLSADVSGISKLVYDGDCKLSSVSSSGMSSIKKR